MKHTFHERLCAGLKALGWRIDPHAKSRYTTFVMPEKQPLFVGSSGALRGGYNATNSRSIGDPSNMTPRYTHILAAGDKALGGDTIDSFE